MHKFHEIDSLRHVIARVDHWAAFHNLESKPTIKFRGTVKLHGNNGGVRVKDGEIIVQSRNRVLGLGGSNDEMGFCQFASFRDGEFRQIATLFAPGAKDVTIYGEWCGIGIHKGAGVCKLPKMFVVFDIKIHDETDGGLNVDLHNTAFLNASTLKWLNNMNIYLITQFPTFEVDIDFNDPSGAAELITDYTLAVEASCPVANSTMFSAYNHGENIGVGEGIVWFSVGHHDQLFFKSKGLEHKRRDVKPKVELAPEVVESIDAFVTLVLPEWRLQQGLDEMTKTNVEINPKNTGVYLAWISKDVLKEHSDTLAANGLDWKMVAHKITNVAKSFYFDAVARLA